MHFQLPLNSVIIVPSEMFSPKWGLYCCNSISIITPFLSSTEKVRKLVFPSPTLFMYALLWRSHLFPLFPKDPSESFHRCVKPITDGQKGRSRGIEIGKEGRKRTGKRRMRRNSEDPTERKCVLSWKIMLYEIILLVRTRRTERWQSIRLCGNSIDFTKLLCLLHFYCASCWPIVCLYCAIYGIIPNWK